MTPIGKGLLIACALALSNTAVAAQQDFPNRPIRIIVPYAAGGPSDNGTRLIQDSLSRELGQPVVIENRGGGGGLNATEAYLKSDNHDGYTLLVGAIGPFGVMPSLRKVSYEVLRDFVPITTVWRSAQVLGVNSGLGFKTVKDFVDFAKANPNKLTLGSAGVGAVSHLAMELLKHEAKINIIHVPFRSSSEGLPQVMGGQISGLFGDGPTMAPHARAGKITPLAVAGPERVPSLPDVPTMAEAGFPDVEAQSWFGLVVSAKTPKPIIERLQKAAVKAQQDPHYQAILKKQGATAGESGPDSFAELIKKDAAKWARVIKQAGIKMQ